QGDCTGAVAGRASTPVPQTGMTQFYATSFISAWQFFLSGRGSTAGTASPRRCIWGTGRKPGDADENPLTLSEGAKQDFVPALFLARPRGILRQSLSALI